MNEYETTITIHHDVTSRVIASADVNGVRVDVLQHFWFKNGAAVECLDLQAVRAGEYTLQPAESRTYVRDGLFHRAGGDAGRTSSHIAEREAGLGSGKTVKAALTAAKRTLDTKAVYDRYAAVAEANIRTFGLDEFEALDAGTTIEPGDLVVIVSHNRLRLGVAHHVTAKVVKALVATPSGRYAQGATAKPGVTARLYRKATPATEAEAGK